MLRAACARCVRVCGRRDILVLMSTFCQGGFFFFLSRWSRRVLRASAPGRFSLSLSLLLTGKRGRGYTCSDLNPDPSSERPSWRGRAWARNEGDPRSRRVGPRNFLGLVRPTFQGNGARWFFFYSIFDSENPSFRHRSHSSPATRLRLLAATDAHSASSVFLSPRS